MDSNHLKLRKDLRNQIYVVLAKAQKTSKSYCVDCKTSTDLIRCNTARYNIIRCRCCVMKQLLEDYYFSYHAKNIITSRKILDDLRILKRSQ